MDQVNIGVIGCGNISGIYLKNLNEMFHNTNVYGVCDLDTERAKEAAGQCGAQVFSSAEELLKCDKIQIILNLTTPPFHYTWCQRALEAGKHVYVEKPLSLTLEEGRALVALAEERGLFLGCAPDTFLGAGIATCRRAVDMGLIGDIVGATAFMLCHGHESWHPSPAFYYQKGGGPMFDMGPYYLSALVSVIGPVKSVAGMTGSAFSQRTVTSEARYGEVIEVEVPTHVCGLLRFANGAIGNIITSFDVWGTQTPCIELYGTKGTLRVPDPNTFGGEVWLKQSFSECFEKLPLLSGHADNSRGLGISDMADCILTGRKNLRANGKMACHVLEIMHAVHMADEKRKEIILETTCVRPEMSYD